MMHGEPEFEGNNRLERVAARASSNFLPLALHPGVEVRTEDNFLQSLGRLQNMIEDLPICFARGAQLSLVYGKDSVLHIHSRTNPFPEYEVLAEERVQYRRNNLGSLLRFEIDQDSFQVQLHETETFSSSSYSHPQVRRTSSPWRAPARGSIYDRSGESGGCAGGGER